MRILLVTHRYLPHSSGGVETWTRAMSAGLSAAGHEVAILSRDDREQGGAAFSWHCVAAASTRVYWLRHRLLDARNHRDTWHDPRLVAPLDAVFDDFKPDLVHLAHPDGWGIVPLELARQRGHATAVTLHDYKWLCGRGQMLHPTGERCLQTDEDRCVRCTRDQLGRSGAHALASRLAPAALLRWAMRDSAADPQASSGEPGTLARQRWRTAHIALLGALRDCDLVFAPSRFVANRYDAEGLGREVIVIANGLDLELPAPRSRRQDKSANSRRQGPLRLGFFANDHPSKGLTMLQDAVASLPAGSVELQVHGPHRETSNGGAWVYRGAYRRSEVLARMAEIDVVAIPSTWDENQPMVALEARAVGRPLVVADVGGLPELVKDGDDGWVLPAGDPERWAETIALLAADPQRVDEAAARSEPPASAASMAEAYLHAYRKALGKETFGPALTGAPPVEDNDALRQQCRTESTAD